MEVRVHFTIGSLTTPPCLLRRLMNSLTTPPSRRGFTYKGCQTKWVSRAKKSRKEAMPLKNSQDRKSRKAQMK